MYPGEFILHKLKGRSSNESYWIWGRFLGYKMIVTWWNLALFKTGKYVSSGQVMKKVWSLSFYFSILLKIAQNPKCTLYRTV